jgi:HEAT repeat protein
MRADPRASSQRNLEQLLRQLTATEADDSRTLDVSRAKAAEALGALGVAEAVPALVQALSHPNQVCVAAALALGRMQAPEAVEPLRAVLEDGTKFWMARGAAAVALGRMGTLAQPALPALERAMEIDCSSSSTSWDTRAHEAAADALLHITDSSASCMLEGKGQRYAMWGFR